MVPQFSRARTLEVKDVNRNAGFLSHTNGEVNFLFLFESLTSNVTGIVTAVGKQPPGTGR